MLDDSARADVALTAERCYYRFSTDDSIEDGDLPPVDDFDTFCDELLAALDTDEGGDIAGRSLRVSVFVDNRVWRPASGEFGIAGLKRAAVLLGTIAPEFAFVVNLCGN